MILNSELRTGSAVIPDESGGLRNIPLRSFYRPILLLLLFFATAVALQIGSGAYRAEFGGYPDEPAHYVTSLMVREYVTGPRPLSPLQFAKNYYAHYPKVAFGHWPPLFYALQACWMLLFSVSRTSVLLELAATTALLAYFVYSEARRWFNLEAGVFAGLLTVCLPLVQIFTDEEMSETLLMLTCFASAIYLARYIESERWQDSAGYGILFSLAVLTKGSAWLLAILPPVALILTRRLHLLRKPSFWISALIVAAICLPWQIMTLQMADTGWAGGSRPSAAYTYTALWEFLPLFIKILGPVLSVLGGIGVIALLLRKRVAAAPAVMFALILAVWIFHSVVPAGIEFRKLIIAVPAIVLFAFAGGFWIAEHLPAPERLFQWRYAVVLIAGATIFFFTVFRIPHETHYGYNEAARVIASNPKFKGARILVSSASVYEGLLISEIAMREPRPQDTIIRATKALAQMEWDGSNYRMQFSGPQQIVQYLEQAHIAIVVTDTFGKTEFPHNELLRETIQQSTRFASIGTFAPHDPAAHGVIQVYRFE